MIDKLKTGNLLLKNTAETLQILQIRDENVHKINSKNHGNADIFEEHKDIIEGIEN